MINIYCITNSKSLHRYVGQTKFSIKNRFMNHMIDGAKAAETIFHKAIKGYGKECFYVELVAIAEDQNEANYLEKYYIKRYNTIYPNGYNMKDGGDSGGQQHQLTKDKLSKIHKEKYKNGELIPFHGNPPPSTIPEIREKLKGPRPHIRGIHNANYGGALMTEEVRRKMSENHPDVSGEKNVKYIDGRWMKQPPKKCKYCDKIFVPYYRSMEFCNRSCSARYRSKILKDKGLHKLVERICPWCGKKFETRHSDKKTCSKSCGQYFRRRKL